MKKLILSIFIIFCYASLFAQQKESNSSPEQANFFEIQKSFNDYWAEKNVVNGYYFENGVKHKAAGWKQFRRWEWYWENRIDPETGAFPDETATAAVGLMNQSNTSLLNGIITKSPSGNWTSKGPNTSSGGYSGIGRINCVAFHPTNSNKFYIGSPSGGIWVTTNGGSSWTVLSDNNTVLGVSSIIVVENPGNPDILYIGTGDRDGGSVWSLGGGQYRDNHSVGILKSTDGGSTWNSTGLNWMASQKRSVNKLLKHPTNDNILYAATSNGVYKTTNAGTNWTQIYSSEFVDMEFKPGNPTYIYASNRNGDIYRSINSGSSFSSILSSSNQRVELAVTPANSNVVYAVVNRSTAPRGLIYKSTNSGASFSLIYNGPTNLLGYYCQGTGTKSQGNYDLCIAADPVNANIVYVGGVNLWKSTNGGTSWSNNNMWTNSNTYNSCGSPVVHADKHYLAFQNNTTLFECNDGGIYKTTNGGTSWNDLTNGMAISQIYRFGVAQSTADETILGLQDNGSKAYLSGTWNDVLGGDGFECAFDPSNQNTIYGELYYGAIHKSTNHGSTWFSIEPSTSQNAAWCTPFVIDPNSSNTLYIGFEEVFKSTNGGSSWSSISSFSGTSTLRSLTVAPSNSSYIYAADQNDLYKTTNGGSSWTNITGTLPVSSAYITYISVKANDPNTIWISMGEYNSHGVYQSTNGGTSWSNISAGLLNIPVMCVIQNKLNTTVNELYAATDVGVYVKSGSGNWTQFSTGLPNVMVTELEIYYNPTTPSNSKLRAATYGRGLWESDLLGTASTGQIDLSFTWGLLNITGNTVDADIRVKNSGSGNAGSFNIGFYVSTDQTITTSDYYIGNTSVSSLAAGDSITTTLLQDVCLIGGIPNGTYYVGAIADYQNTIAETDETNNTGYYTSPQLNLSCTASSACQCAIGTNQYPPSTLSPTTSWQTVNCHYAGEYSRYNVTLGETYMWSYCSADGGLTAVDLVMNLYTDGGTYINCNDDSCSTDPKIVWTASFTGAVKVLTTAYVSTSNLCGTNSTCGNLAYKKVVLTPPDLHFTSGSLSITGNTVDVGVRVKNSGGTNTASFDVGYYVSTDQTITTSDHYIGSSAVSSLVAGDSINVSLIQDVCLIGGIPNGTYYVGVIADYLNVVTESDETNNAGYYTNPTLGLSCTATQYTVTASSNPALGGTTTGAGTYNANQSVSMNATANTGYSFTNWTENSVAVSSNANYTFNITANRTLVANFNPLSYSISLSSNPGVGGTTSGGGTYNYNQSATVVATPAAGYVFDNWTEGGNIVSSSASYNFNVIGARSLVANFSQLTYNIAVSANPSSGGMVSGGGSYLPNQSASVIASPNSGYTFDNWTENGNIVSSSSSYTFTVTGNRTLVANFSAPSFTITTAANPANGGVTSGGGTYVLNSSATVLANANAGWTFVSWTEGATVVSTTPSYTFTVTTSRNLVATFTSSQYLISVNPQPATGGTTSGGGTYAYNQSVTVIATPNSGWNFNDWTEGGTVVSTNPNYTFNVTANRSLDANFSVTKYDVSINASPANGGNYFGNGSYFPNDNVTITAAPYSNFIFDKWTESGNLVSTNLSHSFVINSDRDFIAHFIDVTSIDDPLFKTLELYPNPAKETVYIKGFESGSQLMINIYSIDGKLIHSEEQSIDEVLEISIDYLSDGMYMMVIEEQEIRYNLRFVKE